MKTKFIKIIIISLLLISITSTAAAQAEPPDLTIRLRRDFGYGGFGNDIQGIFSIKVDGPENLTEVQFYIDDELIGKNDVSPFEFQFNTDNFDAGLHTIYAVGILADGSEVRSNELTQDFLSSDSAMGKTLDLVVPILVITGVAVLLGTVVPMLRGKQTGESVTVGEYSAAGGTVCPRCGFPFSRKFFSPNMVTGKLERCPHCGKVSIRPRASQADLAAAEERLLVSRQESNGEIVIDEQDDLKRALDDSRFDD